MVNFDEYFEAVDQGKVMELLEHIQVLYDKGLKSLNQYDVDKELVVAEVISVYSFVSSYIEEYSDKPESRILAKIFFGEPKPERISFSGQMPKEFVNRYLVIRQAVLPITIVAMSLSERARVNP